MPFYSLSLVNFRNLLNDTINICSKEVFFTGENAQGKSNLLEALYFSAYGSSFRTRVDGEMIRCGEKEMSVRVLYKGSEGDSHTTAIVLSSSKKMEKDGKIIRDRKDLLNTMPCVLYSHGDLDFVEGSPERRRFFIDQTLSMYDVLYIDLMRRYRHILKSRNACLKDKNFSLLDTYDVQLVQNGLEMQKRRSTAIFKFNQIFGDLYRQVSGVDGVSIRYLPSWKKANAGLPTSAGVLDGAGFSARTGVLDGGVEVFDGAGLPTEAGVFDGGVEVLNGAGFSAGNPASAVGENADEGPFADIKLPSIDSVLSLLREKRGLDTVMGSTMTGPHRDRIVFERKGEPFVPVASMGQRRLVALVLRTAQAVYYKQETRRLPVLLMDDVLLELDPEKRERMTALLPEYDQLFCTFLPGEPYSKYRRTGTLVYRIENGAWTAEE